MLGVSQSRVGTGSPCLLSDHKIRPGQFCEPEPDPRPEQTRLCLGLNKSSINRAKTGLARSLKKKIELDTIQLILHTSDCYIKLN